MMEKQTKKIVQHSLITTSDGFVDELMDKIEAQQEMETSFVWPLNTILLILIILFLLMSYLLFNTLQIKWLNPVVNISKNAMLLIGSLVFLALINHILKLNESYRYLNKDVS